MLQKFFASWIVVLVLMPFTAPFSTCDLTGIFGSVQRQHAVAPRAAMAARDRRHPDEDVTDDGGALNVPCFSAVGRVRLLPPSGLPLSHTKAPSSSARPTWSGSSAGHAREHTVLTTILRL